jgi:site-specific DNA-methyltransferase (adenine-specific)
VNGRLAILRGDAARLPLPDGSVDMVVTSPPFWGVREYEDDGTPIPGQLGSEPDWRDYLDTLWAWTAEWARVLTPRGSLFVNLGDKYSDRGHGPSQGNGTGRGPQGGAALSQSRGIMEKSLLNLPGRYAIGCTDNLGLIQRACIVWDKANAIPSSARDRVRADHEFLFHFTRSPEYYQATDIIREPIGHPGKTRTANKAREAWAHDPGKQAQNGLDAGDEHPLGRIPGSVWRIASYPLRPPRYYWRPAAETARLNGRGGVEWIRDDAAAWRWLAAGGRRRDRSMLPRDDGALELRAAPNHYAAFPPDLIRPVILGWSPAEVCLACGEGRFPVTSWTGDEGRTPGGQNRYDRHLYSNLATGRLRGRAVTGWACACTPVTIKRPRTPTVTPGGMLGRGPAVQEARYAVTGARHHGNNWPERPPARVYHFDGWQPPPTRPGRVLDPCSGTGTAQLVAAAHGRDGLGTDMSADYCLLAGWRTSDPGELAAALDVKRPQREPDAQGELFSRDEAPR